MSNEFTIHITGGDYKGDIKTLNLSKNFIRKFENAENVMRKQNMRRIGTIIQRDIQKFTRSHKWKSITPAILLNLYGDYAADVTVSGDKMKVAKYLHYGTERHWIAPVNAKALHWAVRGKDYFSKGHFVSGIIAYDYFKITREAQHLIQQYISTLKTLYKK